VNGDIVVVGLEALDVGGGDRYQSAAVAHEDAREPTVALLDRLVSGMRASVTASAVSTGTTRFAGAKPIRRTTMVTEPAARVRIKKCPAVSVVAPSSDSSKKTSAPRTGAPAAVTAPRITGRTEGGCWAAASGAESEPAATIRGRVMPRFMPNTLRPRFALVANFSANRTNGSVSGRNPLWDLAPPPTTLYHPLRRN
jgi:hypothetical protein